MQALEIERNKKEQADMMLKIENARLKEQGKIIKMLKRIGK